MMTQSVNLEHVLNDPLEVDPSTEHALTGAGFPHATVMWHRPTNTCVVTIDRDHLATLIERAASADHDESKCDHSECVPEDIAATYAREGYAKALADIAKLAEAA